MNPLRAYIRRIVREEHEAAQADLDELKRNVLDAIGANNSAIESALRRGGVFKTPSFGLSRDDLAEVLRSDA